jgi:hypothetical protein
MRTSSSRDRALVAKSSSTGSETMELEPSSEGSPLLGIALVSLHVYFVAVYFSTQGICPRFKIYALFS